MEREELIEAICNSLWKLDGTTLAAVALITGFTVDQIEDLGGVV
jgi:hypothetical protein